MFYYFGGRDYHQSILKHSFNHYVPIPPNALQAARVLNSSPGDGYFEPGISAEVANQLPGISAEAWWLRKATFDVHKRSWLANSSGSFAFVTQIPSLNNAFKTKGNRLNPRLVV